jgi:hypothetical protein
MYLDKIYTLQTGVSLKVSTQALQVLITDALSKGDFSALESIRCPTDLYAHLSVVVCSGAEALISRRQRWVSNKMKTDLISKRPVLFSNFCNLFWRNLDEDDPDGDEWQGLIATDQFHSQLIAFLNKLRLAERSLLQCEDTAFAM